MNTTLAIIFRESATGTDEIKVDAEGSVEETRMVGIDTVLANPLFSDYRQFEIVDDGKVLDQWEWQDFGGQAQKPGCRR